LGKATHVGDAVPAGTDDGSDFTFESSEDSLLNFTHVVMNLGVSE
jgi:hypothetical protein